MTSSTPNVELGANDATGDEASGHGGAARRVARNTFAQAAGEATSRIGTLAFYVVMARQLGENGFGDFTFALAVVLLIVLAGFGTDYAVMREVARDPARIDRLFWNTTAIKVLFGTIGIALVVAIGFLGGYGGEVRATIAILGIATLIQVLARTVYATFRGLEDMAPIAISLVVQRYWTAAAGITVLVLGGGLVAAAIVYLSGSVLGLAYIWIRLHRKGVVPSVQISLAEARGLIWDSLPLAIGATFVAVLARLDTVILSLLKDNTAVGIYGAAYRIFDSTTFLTFVFGTAVYPALAQLSPVTKPTVGDAYETSLKAVVAGLLPLALTFILFAKPLIVLVYGSGFAAAATPMRILGACACLWGIFTISMYVLAAQDRQRPVAWIMGLGVVVNGALNLALIPSYSEDGAAAAMTSSMILLAAGMTALAVKTAEQRPSLFRVATGPLAGAAAMALIAVLIGGLGGIPIAVLAYACTVLVVERRLFPADLRLMVSTLKRRAAPARGARPAAPLP